MSWMNTATGRGLSASVAVTGAIFGSLMVAAPAFASPGGQVGSGPSVKFFPADPGDRDDFCEKAPFQPVCDNGPADPADPGGIGLPNTGGQMVPNIDGGLSLPGTPGAI
jgi:hypothetical protein